MVSFRLGHPFSIVGWVVVILLLISTSAIAQSASAGDDLRQAEGLLRQGRPQEALSLLLAEYQSNPKSAAVCYQLGLTYTRLQQLPPAEEFYRKAVELDPRLLAARKNLGTVMWFLNKKAESEREFLIVLKSLPLDPAAHFYLGAANFERKQLEAASEHFDNSGELGFDNPEAFPMVLESFLAAKRLTSADRLLVTLKHGGNLKPELVFQAGILFGRYGFYGRAIQALEEIQDQYADRRALLRNLGLAQLQDHRFSDAIRSLEKLQELGEVNGETQLWLAEAYEESGVPEKAYQAYSKAIEIQPAAEEPYLALAQFAVAHHNNDFGLKVLKRGLEVNPASPKLWLQKGIIEALSLDYLQAQASFQRASEAEPKSTLPRLATGLSQLQAGKLPEAAATFQRAAEMNPGDYRLSYFLALTLIQGGGQNNAEQRGTILSALRRALALNPNHVDSRVSLGQTLLAADQVQAAIRELELAVKVDPKNAAGLYQLGLAYRKQGKTEQAQRVLNRFEEVKTKSKAEEDQAKQELVQILKVVRN